MSYLYIYIQSEIRTSDIGRVLEVEKIGKEGRNKLRKQFMLVTIVRDNFCPLIFTFLSIGPLHMEFSVMVRVLGQGTVRYLNTNPNTFIFLCVHLKMIRNLDTQTAGTQKLIKIARVKVPELNTYLLLNQLAYSILAFPIGTVLSIGPLLLTEKKAFTLPTVGYFMAGGEGIGIIGMKIAEMSDKGFILSRPHDLHLVNLAIALGLISLPIGPSPLSAIGMMTTQFFNSSAKPVLGENLYRLALLVDQDPAKVFAKANMYRRIGNSFICVVSPLLYSQFPSLSFYVIGGIILLFLFILLHSSNGIKCTLQEMMTKDPPISTMHSYDSDEDSKFSTIGALNFIVKIKSERNLAEMINDEEDVENALNKFPIASNLIGDIGQQEDFEIPDLDSAKFPYECEAKNKEKEEHIDQDDIQEFLPGEKDNKPSMAIEKDLDLRGNRNFTPPQSNMLFDMHMTSVEPKEHSSNSKENEENQSSSRLLYFLLVQTFPFLDAAITRLPFVFLTVAIADDFSVELAACVLFAYQIGRAISGRSD